MKTARLLLASLLLAGCGGTATTRWTVDLACFETCSSPGVCVESGGDPIVCDAGTWRIAEPAACSQENTCRVVDFSLADGWAALECPAGVNPGIPGAR